MTETPDRQSTLDIARANADGEARRSARESARTLGEEVAAAEEARETDETPYESPARSAEPSMGERVAEAEDARETEPTPTTTASTEDSTTDEAAGESDEFDVTQFHDGGGYYTIGEEQVRGKDKAVALARKKGLI